MKHIIYVSIKHCKTHKRAGVIINVSKSDDCPTSTAREVNKKLINYVILKRNIKHFILWSL